MIDAKAPRGERDEQDNSTESRGEPPPEPTGTGALSNTESWNELQFLSWSEFKQMAPTIIQLEITRLSRVIEQGRPGADADFRNGLVRSRFALKQFIRCIERSAKDNVEDACAVYLRTAIMNISIHVDGLDRQTAQVCKYVLNRLNYVDYRIRLVY